MNINNFESLNYYNFPISEEYKKKLENVFNSIKSLDMIEFLITLDPDNIRIWCDDANVKKVVKKIREDHDDYDDIDILVCIRKLSKLLKYDHNIKEFIQFLKEENMLGIFRVWELTSDIKLDGSIFTDILYDIVEDSLTYSEFIEDTEQFLLTAKEKVLSV